MTVAELIERLKEFPSDMRVVTAGFDEGGYDDVLVSTIEDSTERCVVIDWNLHGEDRDKELKEELEAWVNSPAYAAAQIEGIRLRDEAKAKRAARLATPTQEDPAWSAAIENNRRKLKG